MNETFQNRTVGELVAERPGRARVFESFGIDYCCGGKRPLAQACHDRGLPLDHVMASLQRCDDNRGPGSESDWTTAPMSDLIDHIVGTHHRYLRSELPRLDALNAKVCSAHGAGNENLAVCHAVFREFCAEIRSHMMKEEEILFPAIKQIEAEKTGHRCCATIAAPISVMEAEHESAGNALARMRTLTNGFTPPPEACNTYKVWLAGLAALEQDMHRHVHKENNILFPRALAMEAATSSR